MRTLFWKDYRVNRQVLVMGLFLLVTPYLAVLSYLWYSEGLIGTSASVWAALLQTGARASLIFSVLTIALLGGNIIAGERRDRSAEFLAYLPPSRAAILGSKTLLSAAVFAVIWSVYLVIAELVVPWLIGGENATRGSEQFTDARNMVVAVAVALFGMAWLGSSMLESPTYSIAIGVGAAIIAPLMLNLCYFYTGWPQRTDFLMWLQISYFVFGGGGFVIGWMCYLRRVEP